MVDILHITCCTAFTILHVDLNMSHVCARYVMRLLMPQQKLIRVEICQELKYLVAEHGKAYLNSIIIGGESWFRLYDSKSI